MLIFKGRLVSGEQGLRGNFVFFFLFIYGFVLFQATTGSRSTVQSVGKEIPDQGKKKNWERGRGEKKKSSKKTQVSKYIRNTSAPSVKIYTHYKSQVHLTEHRQESALPRSGQETARPPRCSGPPPARRSRRASAPGSHKHKAERVC